MSGTRPSIDDVWYSSLRKIKKGEKNLNEPINLQKYKKPETTNLQFDIPTNILLLKVKKVNTISVS